MEENESGRKTVQLELEFLIKLKEVIEKVAMKKEKKMGFVAF